MSRITQAGRVLIGKAKAVPMDGAALIVPAHESGRPQQPRWSTDYLVNQAVKVNSLVWAGADFWATNGSEPPLVAMPDGMVDPDHALSQAFAQAASPWYSQEQMWAHVLYQLAHSQKGAYLFCVTDNGGDITEIWPKSADEVRPIASSRSFISGFEYNVGSGWRPVPDGIEVLWFRLISPDPKDRFSSYPPVLAAKRELTIDAEALRWLEFTLKNMGHLSALVGVEGIDQETANTLRDQMNEKWAGAEHGGKFGVVGGKVTLHELMQRFSDLDFGAVQDRVEVAIARGFGIPVELLQTLATVSKGEGLSGNAYREKKLVAYDMRMKPLWRNLAGTVFGAFGEQYGLSRQEIGFDLSEIEGLKDGIDSRLERARMMATYASVAERRQYVGTFVDLEERTDPGIDDIPELILRQRYTAATGGLQLASPCGHIHKSDVSPELREYADRIDTKATGLETGYAKIAERTFEAERELARKAMDEAGKAAPTVAQLMRAALSAITPRAWEEAFRDVIAADMYDAADDVIASLDVGISFDIGNPKAVEAILQRTQALAGNVTKTTENAIRDIVADGIMEGATPDEIRRSIISTDIGPWGTKTAGQRASTIARTETIGALNAGHDMGAYQVADETGRDVIKEWVTAGDGLVRPEHAMASTEGLIPLSDNFASVGGPYPGGTGDPAMDINCRCILAYQMA